jgi:hypothetical protein
MVIIESYRGKYANAWEVALVSYILKIRCLQLLIRLIKGGPKSITSGLAMAK